jgi:hypothetical protein
MVAAIGILLVSCGESPKWDHQDRAQSWQEDCDAVAGLVQSNPGKSVAELVETLRTLPNDRCYRAVRYLIEDGRLVMRAAGVGEIIR